MRTATAQLYETDFYGWIQRQVDALRAGNLSHLDLDNLISPRNAPGRLNRRWTTIAGLPPEYSRGSALQIGKRGRHRPLGGTGWA